MPRGPYLPWWFRASLGHDSRTAAELPGRRSGEVLRQHMGAAALTEQRCRHSSERCNPQQCSQCPPTPPKSTPPSSPPSKAPPHRLSAAWGWDGAWLPARTPSCWDKAGRVNCRAKHRSQGGCLGGGGLCNAAIIWGGLQCISYGLGEASSALGGTVGPHGSTVSSSCTRMGIPALPWSERGQSRPQPQRSDGSEDDLQGPFCPNHSVVDL